MGVVGTCISAVFAGCGFISTYVNKEKLDHLQTCKKVTSVDFKGFGYVEGRVTSQHPFNFEFGNTPYSLLIKQMVYNIPKTRYTNDQPITQTDIVYGLPDYVDGITIGDFKVSQSFAKTYFPVFYLNKTYSFNPSIDINFYAGSVAFNALNSMDLYGLPDKTQMTVIADFENGKIVRSNKINYVGKCSFADYKKGVELSYDMGCIVLSLGLAGLVYFANTKFI